MTKTPPDTMVDKAAMLLSTDWFSPYWSLIGIEADKERECFQNGCREIVRQFVGHAETYYLINFSQERLERTREDFRQLVRSCKLAEADIARINELSADKPGRDQLEKTAWLFRSLHGELLGTKNWITRSSPF